MTLVIGFGNPLRGDDGAGPAVAEAVRDARPDIPVLVPHQLVPELSEAVASASVVVFVDAASGTGAPGAVGCRAVRGTNGGAVGHALSPEGLLALTREVYGVEPAAWLVTVQGSRFDHAPELSAELSAGVPAAAALVLALLTPS